jgi:MOSC domain-containing protein YiiM
MRLVSVQVGLPRTRAAPDGRAWTSAYGKHPVSGPVRIGRLGLDGDAQANRRWHGGPDMAVLAYAQEHYSAWRGELSWPELPYGGFGENLTVEGAMETETCIGDVWRAGTALLQVSEPRKPCRNISRYWGRPDLLRKVDRSGRHGFYLRVLEEGVVEPGQQVVRVARPYAGWTVVRAVSARRHVALQRAEAEALLRVEALGRAFRAQVSRRLEKR